MSNCQKTTKNVVDFLLFNEKQPKIRHPSA